MNKIEWLQQQPLPEEVSKNDDGSEFIPIVIVETNLDELTDGDWSTKNFQYSVHVYGTTLLISASVELCVSYAVNIGKPGYGHWVVLNRTLVGAVTFTDLKHGSNLDFAATGLSEAIKNAAKKLGPRFGKNLNGRGGDLNKATLPLEPLEKPIMDVITQKKYENAKKSGDTKTLLEIENYYQL